MVLSVKNLEVAFHTRNGVAKAADGISFELPAGKTIGIVGESGSGKSVSCSALMGLIPQPPGRVTGGEAWFEGKDLLAIPERDLRKLRGNRISMIFQDPMTSLNPWLKIGTQLIEPLQQHQGLSKKAAWDQAIQAMAQVGILQAERRIQAYPHEFSGGMRQRVMIAMALINRPAILLADEPTTALDVTVQKQVLELMKARQMEMGSSTVFITHDLQVVSNFCDYVYVMYAGRFVEAAATAELFQNPKHAYTQALLNSIPSLQPSGQRLRTIPGTPPDLTRLGPGCAFRARQSPDRQEKCSTTQRPLWEEISAGHFVQNCPGCISNF